MGTLCSSPAKDVEAGDASLVMADGQQMPDSYVVRDKDGGSSLNSHLAVSAVHGADEYDHRTHTITGANSTSSLVAEMKLSTRSPDLTFNSVYELGELLGVGNEGKVYECWKRRHPSQKYAVKIVDETQMDDEEIEMLQREVDVLKQLTHPNIERLYDVFFEQGEQYHTCYIVTELLAGGELINRILEKDHYSEKIARSCVKLLQLAIAHCHKLGIVHRDLKPQNLMLQSDKDDWHIKVVDFGMAKRVSRNKAGKRRERLTSICGTPQYMAPEIFMEKDYGEKVDIWAIGVITYILLSGWPPFIDLENDSEERLAQLVKEAHLNFDDPVWEHVSPAAIDFVRKALTRNFSHRPTAESLLQHEWITGHPKLDWHGGIFAHLGHSHIKLKSFHVHTRKHKKKVKTSLMGAEPPQAPNRGSSSYSNGGSSSYSNGVPDRSSV